MSIELLQQRGLIETVQPDLDGARIVIDECERHLASATLIADGDPSGAFQLSYDAARKAIAAHNARRRSPCYRSAGKADQSRKP